MCSVLTHTCFLPIRVIIQFFIDLWVFQSPSAVATAVVGVLSIASSISRKIPSAYCFASSAFYPANELVKCTFCSLSCLVGVLFKMHRQLRKWTIP